MSESNGVFKLNTMGTGRKPVQFGDCSPDDPVVTIDVIETYNLYSDMVEKFRDEKGEVPKDRYTDLSRAKWGFVQEVIRNHVADAAVAAKLCEGLSQGNALFFCKWMQDEANRLVPFFKVESAEKPSSPESSPTVAYLE